MKDEFEQLLGWDLAVWKPWGGPFGLQGEWSVIRCRFRRLHPSNHDC